MTGYRFLDALRLEAARVQPVDCGTCPVTLACAIGQGGTGYVFKCCGSTGVETQGSDGESLLLIIDCARHAFRNPHELAKSIGKDTTCPLCGGGIMDDVLLKLTAPCAWVPTVHARVPIETRLDVWRRAYPQAMERASAIKARKGPEPCDYTWKNTEEPQS